MKNLDSIRHSTAHLLAATILSMYPDAKNAIGPSIENGFYQDFDLGDVKITDEDLPKIEKEMKKMLATWDSFEIKEVPVKQAKKDFSWNPYKLELIEEFAKEGKTITETKQGKFLDLCKGGHSENPAKDIGAFKLLSVAGAYWRGSEKNKMLTRIYGTAFSTQAELDAHLALLEEAKKRDHKKLGRDLDLYFFHETSPGMPYWLPKGFILYKTLLDFSQEIHKQFGYREVMTPILSKKELYETSGHWTHYRADMFVSDMGEHEVFGIKPMNCPNAMTIFGLNTRSYRDLPLRLSETTALHRFELSGTLNGLFRAREFHQDDAHVFMRQDQIGQEFKSIMEMIEIFYKAFHLSYRLRFGTRPEKFMGEPKDWDIAEEALRKVLDHSKKEYVLAPGEGAFYGPKVDILMKDSLGREWQTGTVQLDYQQPKNFKLHFADETGKDVTPAAMHRAIYGSFERFIGILTEHYAGAFPVWLAPVQVAILPISEKVIGYAKEVEKKFLEDNIRVELDMSNESLGSKIRTHTLQKVPFLCIIGDKEVEASSDQQQFIAVRTREGKDLGRVELSTFLTELKQTIEKRI